MAAAQHHKHVLIGCPAAADYESTVVMRDDGVAEDVALQDVVPFSHHTRTEEILSTIAESRFFGEVRRVDVAFTISASETFSGAGKERQRTTRSGAWATSAGPARAWGIGVEPGERAFSRPNPVSSRPCVSRRFEVFMPSMTWVVFFDFGAGGPRRGRRVDGVFTASFTDDIRGDAIYADSSVLAQVVYFGENSTKPCHMHCSYVHPLQQSFKVIGDNKILRCDDFAYPRFGRDCSYTIESFPAGDEGRSALVDLGQCVVSALNTSRCFNAQNQRVSMLDQFADLCLLEDENDWRRQGFEGKHQARELFSSQIIGTQAVVQALVESLRNPGKAIAVPEDNMPPPPPRDSRMRFD